VNDADTGLVYMQQRYYDPIAGRFLSQDPVTTDADTGSAFNRYAYAQNNPYRYTDPDGRIAELAVPVAIIGAFVAAAHYVLPGREAREAALSEAFERVRAAMQSTGQRPSKTPNTGPPGSTHVNPGSGQERTYGPDGRPVRDVDHDHPHDGIQPHQHDWVDGVRQPGVPIRAPSPGAPKPAPAPGSGGTAPAPSPAAPSPAPPAPSQKTNPFDGQKTFGRLS
jgi:RHS repeat-associated protein